jgi:hypothetical protein
MLEVRSKSSRRVRPQLLHLRKQNDSYVRSVDRCLPRISVDDLLNLACEPYGSRYTFGEKYERALQVLEVEVEVWVVLLMRPLGIELSSFR